jgi:hypothetical protein
MPIFWARAGSVLWSCIDSVYPDPPLQVSGQGVRDEASQGAGQGALAAAGRTGDQNTLALLNGQAEAVQDGRAAEIYTKILHFDSR